MVYINTTAIISVFVTVMLLLFDFVVTSGIRKILISWEDVKPG